MATAAASPAPTGGVSASMWADKPMPPRGERGKRSEFGSGFRGAPRGAPRGRGRGGRGGRGGSGGRTGSSKAPATAPEDGVKKVNAESSKDEKDQTPLASLKPTAPPSPTTTTSSQNNGPTKGTNKAKPPRKNSDQRPPRKQPSLGVDTLNAASSNASSSPSVSPSRRRRSTAHKTAPPPAAPPAQTNHARKQSTASEQNSTQHVEKPAPALTKDLPPHMAPVQINYTGSDIAHNIDALVERVRAVAMDRPHTPGSHSHFDWAGDDEDDSLPDLDDWGVTSSLSTNGPATDVADGEKVGVSVISPILQDALRPLPNIIDIDISTPSIKLHDVNGMETKLKASADAGTPRAETKPAETKVEAPTTETVSSDNDASQADHSSKADEKATTEAPASSTEHPKSPSPPRGLAASIHASQPPRALSPPPPQRLPNPPRGGFNPSHNRAHTVGGRFKESPADAGPRRNDISHGRNHSTPHTGPGTATAHARPQHHTRPVISGDAISRLARSLGGALPKRQREAAAATAKAE
ncbi:hypothetical protein BC629DRAFT_1560208 [Irpex lacteus]|nr:hypothetical protein BC629DRAFT_1560208 [Irpex lacteus]